MAYPGYQDGAPGVDPMYTMFTKVASADGTITVVELQQFLSYGSDILFNAETTRLLIAMLDRDYNGSMGFTEFKEMLSTLRTWNTAFTSADTNPSGNIDQQELKRILTTYGYNLSDDFYRILIYKFDRREQGAIAFDDFMQCCIVLKSLTSHFRRRDAEHNGNADLAFGDLLQLAFSF